MKRATFTATDEMIGKYLCMRLYTDTRLVGRIVGFKSKTVLIIQSMDVVRNKTKMEFELGGFAANCTNQSEQMWEFVDTNDIYEFKIKPTEMVGFGSNKSTGLFISDTPKYYYDFNF